ncbi:MAG: SsgA family sporulation/cell division regulator [Mycobacteriales bacterium]
MISDRHLSGHGRTTRLRLNWWTGDPLAVRLALTAIPDHPSLPRGNWVVLRDFLRYGTEEPTGDGQVRIRPDISPDRIRLDLLGEWGGYWLTIPREALIGFLDATEARVPTGSERSDAEVDALIARLLVDG